MNIEKDENQSEGRERKERIAKCMKNVKRRVKGKRRAKEEKKK
jgi:hypothetical protein